MDSRRRQPLTRKRPTVSIPRLAKDRYSTELGQLLARYCRQLTVGKEEVVYFVKSMGKFINCAVTSPCDEWLNSRSRSISSWGGGRGGVGKYIARIVRQNGKREEQAGKLNSWELAKSFGAHLHCRWRLHLDLAGGGSGTEVAALQLYLLSMCGLQGCRVAGLQGRHRN